jgi:hypothetical protein
MQLQNLMSPPFLMPAASSHCKTAVEQLEEGQTVTGTISDIWLFHGLQIDFDAEFDGLVPMYQDQWMEDGVREALMPGDAVVARVHKVNAQRLWMACSAMHVCLLALPPEPLSAASQIRQSGLYRWPVQLELLEPVAMAGHVMNPDEYEPPISHAWAVEQGMSMNDILEATGRTYEPSNYLIPQNQRSLANELVQVGMQAPLEKPAGPLFMSPRPKLNRSLRHARRPLATMWRMRRPWTWSTPCRTVSGSSTRSRSAQLPWTLTWTYRARSQA